MEPQELIALAIDVAEDGLRAGELPIGAVVVMGDDVIATAYTQERALKRRLVHADLLALEAADRRLGWAARSGPLQLAVNLEPCVMCIGAAMSMNVADVVFGLESPGDGGSSIAGSWVGSADAPQFTAPRVVGGVQRAVVQEQFRRYARTAAESGLTRWARTLADLS